MNQLPFNLQPIRALIYGAGPQGQTPLRTDGGGRPVLGLDAVQTIAADNLDIRNLTPADEAVITATGFDIRSLSGSRDSVETTAGPFTVLTGSASILAGGTTVLTADLSAYSRASFLVRVTALGLLTTVNLQLAPVNTASYFTTVASATGLALGGTYVLLPTFLLRYARIYATGVGSTLTAYCVAQV